MMAKNLEERIQELEKTYVKRDDVDWGKFWLKQDSRFDKIQKELSELKEQEYLNAGEIRNTKQDFHELREVLRDIIWESELPTWRKNELIKKLDGDKSVLPRKGVQVTGREGLASGETSTESQPSSIGSVLEHAFKRIEENKNPSEQKEMNKILDAIKREVEIAASIWQPFSSLHEAYAVLLEEVEELWDEVKRSQKDLDRIPYVKEEAIQVAAMAMRMIYDCCEGYK